MPPVAPAAPVGADAPIARLDLRFVLDATDHGTLRPAVRADAERVPPQITVEALSVLPASDAPLLATTTATTEVDANARATVTLLLPPRPTVVNVRIDAGSIGGHTAFRGALDLVAGPNVMTVHPAGSGLPADLAAELVEHVARTPSLHDKVGSRLCAWVAATIADLPSDRAIDEMVADAIDRLHRARPPMSGWGRVRGRLLLDPLLSGAPTVTPAATAAVVLVERAPDLIAVPDSAGVFELDGIPAGTIYLVASAAVTGGAAGRARSAPIAVLPGRMIDVGDLTVVPAAATAEGMVRVAGAGGAALAGVRVTAMGRIATSSANGAWRLDGMPAGAHPVQFEKPGFVSAVQSVWFSAAGSGYSEVLLTPTDRFPPVISRVEATAAGDGAIDVTWFTNEPATSQVDYGEDAAFGLSSPLDATLTRDHRVRLTGVPTARLLHARVRSADAGGRLATGTPFTFATAGLPGPGRLLLATPTVPMMAGQELDLATVVTEVIEADGSRRTVTGGTWTLTAGAGSLTANRFAPGTAPGARRLTVSYTASGSTVTAELAVRVLPAFAELTLAPATVTLSLAQSLDLRNVLVEAGYADGTRRPIAMPAWAVATGGPTSLSESIVTPRSAGTAAYVAAWEELGIRHTATLTVQVLPPLTELRLTPPTVSMRHGDTLGLSTISVTATRLGLAPQTVTTEAGWSVAPAAGAIVAGRFIPAAPGTARLFASWGDGGEVSTAELSVEVTPATAPALVWQRPVGGEGLDRAFHLAPITDGGFWAVGDTLLSAGEVTNSHGTMHDALVMRFDAARQPTLIKAIGGTANDFAAQVEPTADGGCIFVGNAQSTDGDITRTEPGVDGLVVKLDAAGQIQWQRHFGGSSVDELHSIAADGEGGYVAAGFTGSNDRDAIGARGGGDAWVIRFDANGNLLWSRCFGGSYEDAAKVVAPTPDGGFVFAGTTYSSDGDVSGYHDRRDIWVAKLAGNGVLRWQRCVGGGQPDWLQGMRVLPDGGVVLAGNTQSSDADLTANRGGEDALIARLDATGNLLWARHFGGTNTDRADDVEAVTDGFVLCGMTASTDGDLAGIARSASFDAWVTRLDLAGGLVWQRCLGGTGEDRLMSVRARPDGSLLCAGYTDSTGGDVAGHHGYVDAWFVHLQ